MVETQKQKETEIKRQILSVSSDSHRQFGGERDRP